MQGFVIHFPVQRGKRAPSRHFFFVSSSCVCYDFRGAPLGNVHYYIIFIPMLSLDVHSEVAELLPCFQRIIFKHLRIPDRSVSIVQKNRLDMFLGQVWCLGAMGLAWIWPDPGWIWGWITWENQLWWETSINRKSAQTWAWPGSGQILFVPIPGGAG